MPPYPYGPWQIRLNGIHICRLYVAGVFHPADGGAPIPPPQTSGTKLLLAWAEVQRSDSASTPHAWIACCCAGPKPRGRPRALYIHAHSCVELLQCQPCPGCSGSLRRPRAFGAVKPRRSLGSALMMSMSCDWTACSFCAEHMQQLTSGQSTAMAVLPETSLLLKSVQQSQRQLCSSTWPMTVATTFYSCSGEVSSCLQESQGHMNSFPKDQYVSLTDCFPKACTQTLDGMREVLQRPWVSHTEGSGTSRSGGGRGSRYTMLITWLARVTSTCAQWAHCKFMYPA